GVIDRQQKVAFVHFRTLGDQDLRDRSGDLGIDVDVLALRLDALDDSIGIDSFGIWIGRGIEGRRQSFRLLPGNEGADERERQAYAGYDEDDLTAHSKSPNWSARSASSSRPPSSRCGPQIRRCGCRASR